MKKILFWIALILLSPNAVAFEGLFDKPKNLKALPKDISARDLRETMRGFAFALGARCTHCHVSERPEGAKRPVTIFDRDDKENKKIARKMIKLVADINARVKGLGRGKDHFYQTVTCVTCHRGQKRPILIQTVMDDAFAKGGVAEVIRQYNKLKARYYGNHTYDFTPFTFAEYAQSFVRKGDLETAESLARFNVKNNPNKAYSQQVLGQISMKLGKFDEAVKAFEAANTLRPNAFLQKLLNEAVRRVQE